MKWSILLVSVFLFLGGFAGATENTVIDEIQVLNLLNGLELQKEQAELILEKARAAEAVRKERKEKLLENYNQHLEVYRELKDALISGEELTDDLKAKIHKAQIGLKEMEDSYSQQLKSISLEVQDKLQDFQIYALEQFKPCLIPPKGELRVGQAEGSEGLEKILEKIREPPSNIYEKRKEKIAKDMVEKTRLVLPKGYSIDEEAEKERIMSILDKARALSDVDFAVKKKELAGELKSKYALPKLPIDAWAKVDKFLLTPEVIPLLEVLISTRWK